MASKAAPIIKQAARSFSTIASNTSRDQIGSLTTAAYWTAVISAPLAGALLISQATTKDNRFSNMRQFDFLGSSQNSSLDKAADAFMHLRR